MLLDMFCNLHMENSNDKKKYLVMFVPATLLVDVLEN